MLYCGKKLYIAVFMYLLAMLCTSLFFALPRLKKTAVQIYSSLGPPAAEKALQSLEKEFLLVSGIMAVAAVVLIGLAMWHTRMLIKPVDFFIGNLKRRFSLGETGDLKTISERVESICRNDKILDSLPVGVMVVDRQGEITVFNQEAGRITGRPPGAAVGKSILDFFPHNYYNCTMGVVKTGKEHFGLRNIIKTNDFFKEILFNISPMYAGEHISGAIATLQDVTPQNKMIEVETAYNLSKNLASQKDLGGVVRMIPEAAAKVVNIEAAAVFLADSEGRLHIQSSYGIPAQFVKEYHDSPVSLASPDIIELFKNKDPFLHADTRDERIKPLLIIPNTASFYAFPVRNEKGLIIGMLSLYGTEENRLSQDDIYLIQTLSGQLNNAILNFYQFRKMYTAASVDGLTGLYNKQRFMEKAGVELERSAGSVSPLSLAMIDIDFFKKVNDNYGHQAGDQVLKDLARLISSSVRESDVVCRFGGEEFSIIMPGTAKKTALEVIQRIRQLVESTLFQTESAKKIRITISGGVASFPEDAGQLEKLILFSDTALYEAKKTGRNKVVGYSKDLKM